MLTQRLLQRALAETKWKEYVSGGRAYFYNVSVVQQSLTPILNRLGSPDRDERVKMGHPRRAQRIERESRKGGRRCPVSQLCQYFGIIILTSLLPVR